MYSCDDKAEFPALLQSHMILQKSFEYADLLLSSIIIQDQAGINCPNKGDRWPLHLVWFYIIPYDTTAHNNLHSTP